MKRILSTSLHAERKQTAERLTSKTYVLELTMGGHFVKSD